MSEKTEQAAKVGATPADISRSPLALAMLCAWNNIPEGQAPPAWWSHPNDQNRIAWERVAEAARKHIEGEGRATITPSPLNTRSQDDAA
jgi:hypothetical protein